MTKSLTAELERYLAKYDAMVKEGQALAEERKKRFGDYTFDESKYKKLPDLRPAHTAWRRAQADSVGVIRELHALLVQAEEALDKCWKDEFYPGHQGLADTLTAIRNAGV